MSNVVEHTSVLGLLLLVPWLQLQAAKSAAPPNIVFIGGAKTVALRGRASAESLLTTEQEPR